MRDERETRADRREQREQERSLGASLGWAVGGRAERGGVERRRGRVARRGAVGHSRGLVSSTTLTIEWSMLRYALRLRRMLVRDGRCETRDPDPPAARGPRCPVYVARGGAFYFSYTVLVLVFSLFDFVVFGFCGGIACESRTLASRVSMIKESRCTILPLDSRFV